MGKENHLCLITDTLLSPPPHQVPWAMSLLPSWTPAPQQPPPEGTWSSDLHRPPVEISILQALERTGVGGRTWQAHPGPENRSGPPQDLRNPSPFGLDQVSFQVIGREGWPLQRNRKTPSLNEYKCLIHGRKMFPAFRQPDK